MELALAKMSLDTYSLARVAHILGFTMWIAGMVAVFVLLRAQSQVSASERSPIAGAARAMGILMEVGSLLAIGFGLWLAFASPRFASNAFASGGWLHLKLTVVVLALGGMHGFLRVKMRKFREGQLGVMPGWVLSVIVAGAAIAILLGAHHSLLRK